MPTYSYECTACHHEFERFQLMSERPVKVCPSCGKRKVRRLIGAGAAIIFKGSGFYQTDYRSEEYKSRAKAESEAAKPASSDAAKSKGDGTKKADPKPSASSKSKH